MQDIKDAKGSPGFRKLFQTGRAEEEEEEEDARSATFDRKLRPEELWPLVRKLALPNMASAECNKA